MYSTCDEQIGFFVRSAFRHVAANSIPIDFYSADSIPTLTRLCESLIVPPKFAAKLFILFARDLLETKPLRHVLTLPFPRVSCIAT